MHVLCTSVDRSSLPVLVPLLVTLKLRSLDREPHKVADCVLKLLLLLSIVHHHERVDCLFPPCLLHAVMVAQVAHPVPRQLTRASLRRTQ
jgi:hypothetical protein